MDAFARTFLPAAAEAGLPIVMISRHLPLLRRCVSPGETALLVARAHRPGVRLAGQLVLLVTNRHMVVSRESRLHRVRLHLAAELRQLSQVAWTAHPRAGVELAATAADGVRERFWLPDRDPRRVRQLDARLSHACWSRTVPPGAAPLGFAPRASARLAPTGAG
jgi:hypothetical protein